MDVNMTGNTEENTQREQNLKTAGQLFSFIQASPSPFHAVANMKRELDAHGYAQHLEGDEWRLEEEEILCHPERVGIDRVSNSETRFHRIPDYGQPQ